MDFEQLRIFMVLAEEGTFLGAANRLATSRSRVRRKLDQLEAAAGTALLLRDQGSLRPTRAGEVLVARGSVLLAAADQLIRSVHDVGVEPSGRLRIALPIGRPPDGWSRACHALQTHYPDLEIETYSSARPTDLLPSPAEIALTFDDEIPGGCHGVAVGEFPMRLLASETYLARHGHPEKPEDLRHHRLAIWRTHGRDADRLLLCDGRSLRVTPVFVSDEPRLVHRVALSGDAIAYLPALPDLIDPALESLLADELAGFVRETLVIPDVLADLPRVQRFVDLTRSAAPVARI
ncbi:MAG: LysR family transcriptional regulator [Spirochaetaceae bacterium]|nr:LysR family transcriptional regulator [Myxococcales bacterium]MCB9723027.1 LysR family transcriptional regulator [Spirochaetaceae bacterium]